ncbi:unnamed protein product [Urochloa decumbens]|uniref:Uncharacterized protein n=1 Tax=Urochloa decumbens TaxID=240449 RepID=A0ABC9AGF9_9POAL
MARAIAAAVLALAVFCLLVAPAPARRPADLPPRAAAVHAVVVDREAAAEPLLPKPAAGAVDEPTAMDEWVRPAVPGKAEAEAEDDEAGDVDERPYETDSESDCDSDSDDEDEGGIFGWLWSLLAHRF